VGGFFFPNDDTGCVHLDYSLDSYKIFRFNKGDHLKLDRGYLIVFEGIDGTGKSTHCRLLGDYLESRGATVRRLFEPTKGEWGMKIRKILKEGRGEISPEEELSWFINDRREDVENNIKPALANNEIVILDRYYFSTAAYQGALGLDPEKICRENEVFSPKPDIVFLFITSPEQCLERIQKSRTEKSSFERLDYLEKVQRIFNSFSDPVIRRIDTTPQPKVVHEKLRYEVDEMIIRQGNL
jgi:dTMP kinase